MPNMYSYVEDLNNNIDPLGLINFRNLTDNELIDKIGEVAYRNKRNFGSRGFHGVIHRIREQITGAMRPPSQGWRTHEGEIKSALKNLREGLDQARIRGIMDKVLEKYPNINKVANLSPPKGSDTKVPKICQ